MPFPCSKCGLCCQHVDKSDLTNWLNRGDGVCVNFNQHSELCEIYETRPNVCQIDASFELFSASMSLIEYYKENANVCNSLQSKHGASVQKRIEIFEI